MDAEKLSILNRKLYSFIEKLPEYPAIELMRFFFRILPLDHLTDYEVHDESLRTVLRGRGGSGLELNNPVILAAGYHEPFILKKASRMGFGAVTAKVSMEPMEGNPKPTIIRTEQGPVNSIGYRNQGMRRLYSDLDEMAVDAPGLAVILNMSDSSIGSYCRIVKYMDANPAVRMFEINECLNTPEGERLDFFRDHRLAKDLFSEVSKLTDKPIGLKLPRLADFPEIYGKTIPIAIDSGITVLNYANGKRVNDSRLVTGEGSLTGPVLFEDTLENVEMLYHEFGNHADIIGTGGIYSPASAYLVRKKGAKAVSYITAFPSDIFLAKRINQVFSESGFK
jgi:dihydroorotate dehydrogenase (NAD+) catalytic subunit